MKVICRTAKVANSKETFILMFSFYSNLYKYFVCFLLLLFCRLSFIGIIFIFHAINIRMVAFPSQNIHFYPFYSLNLLHSNKYTKKNHNKRRNNSISFFFSFITFHGFCLAQIKLKNRLGIKFIIKC